VPAADPDAAQVCLRLETPVATGRLWLPVGAASAQPADGGEALRQRARRLAVVASVQVGVTDIAAGELAALTLGDAVVFEGYRADVFAVDAAWPGDLALGESGATHAAPLQIDASGAITLAGGFEGRGDALHFHGKEIGMNTAGITEVTAALAAAPVEVVAEVGRIRLRGEEVLGLAAGAVLTLPNGRKHVTLRVAGEALAEGELVDVDGELGVRVTRMAAR
jgi:type III secretion system YscQ/HrcQ family protein